MFLSTPVLVTSLSTLHQGRYFAGMGVDYISFSAKGLKENGSPAVEDVVSWLSVPHLYIQPERANNVSYPDHIALLEETNAPSPAIRGWRSEDFQVLEVDKRMLADNTSVLIELCAAQPTFLALNWSVHELPYLKTIGPFGLAFNIEAEGDEMQNIETIESVLEALEK